MTGLPGADTRLESPGRVGTGILGPPGILAPPGTLAPGAPAEAGTGRGEAEGSAAAGLRRERGADPTWQAGILLQVFETLSAGDPRRPTTLFVDRQQGPGARPSGGITAGSFLGDEEPRPIGRVVSGLGDMIGKEPEERGNGHRLDP